MKVAVWELVEILQDHLRDNGALMGELLFKFGLVEGGELVFVAGRTWQVGVLACVYGYQFAVFKDILLQNFRAKGKQRLTDIIAGLSLPSLVELFEENA